MAPEKVAPSRGLLVEIERREFYAQAARIGKNHEATKSCPERH
jgi:hypothetical protein